MPKRPENPDFAADEPTLPTPQSGTDPKTATLQIEPAEKLGATIGPYKLLDELGEGGMGTVFLAEQERPVRRRVALKVIKPGLDTAQVIARFEAERQALALMDHTNIARVLDAGTTASGRPYFVMELVQGVPITNYCDTHRVPLRGRLELFLPVCRAVQHAHQKGIIHRDLKPSNLLITVRDDRPVAKIIDFGIAKATTQRLTERTLYTQYGQLVGTPDYMSPEQAGMGGLDVDTRSDVYSLGAVLYELLCGETPLGRERLKQLDFMSMINTIYEDEPLPPSRRLTDFGEKSTEVARRRDVEPHRLAQTLRGELDWIVTKALEKERTRRYESASALAADLERYLNNEPVEASPPSTTYRLRKFVRRNRAPLAAAVSIALVLLGGIVVSGWQAYRATEAEQEMAIERQAALDAKGKAEGLLGEVQKSKNLAEERRIDAEKARKLAEQRGTDLAAALSKANDAAENERKARDEIERRLREADAMRLAMQSKDARSMYPQRSLLLAAEAIEATRRKREPIVAAANQALRDALDNIGGRPLAGHQSSISFLETTPDGRWLFTSDGVSVRRWDLTAIDPAESSTLVGPAELSHAAMAISRDGRWLATLSRNVNPIRLRLWDLQAEKLTQPSRELSLATQEYVNDVVFSPDAHWVAAKSYGTAWLWDLTAKLQTSSPVVLRPPSNSIERLAFSANGTWAVTQDYRQPTLWKLAGGEAKAVSLLGSEPQNDIERSIVSPDGRWLAARLRTPRLTLKVWDLSAEDPLQSPHEVPGSAEFLVAVYANAIFDFTADGRYFATTLHDETRLWDLATQTWNDPDIVLSTRQSNNPNVSTDRIRRIATDRHGRVLAAVTEGGSIFSWKLRIKDPAASRQLVGRLPTSAGLEFSVSASGRWLITTTQGGGTHLWDLWWQDRANGSALAGHDGGIAGSAMGGGSLGAGPGATLLEIAAGNRTSLDTFERWLVTRGADSTPRLWDLLADDRSRGGIQTGVKKFSATNVALRPDGKWVVQSNVHAVQIIDLEAANPLSKPMPLDEGIGGSWSSNDVPLSRDGRWFAMNHGSSISIWDLTDAKLEAQSNNLLRRVVGSWLSNSAKDAPRPKKVVTAESNQSFSTVVMSPQGRWLLAGINGRWRLWDLQSDNSQPAIAVPQSTLYDPLFSANDTWLVGINRSAPERPELSLWNLDTPDRRHFALETPAVYGERVLGFSGDGQWLAMAGRGIGLWRIGPDGPTNSPAELSGDDVFQRVQVSHDGRWIAATSGPSIHLWDRQSPQPDRAQVLRGHDQSLNTLAFSPDDRWLVSASYAADVRLWNLSANQAQDTTILLGVGDGATNRTFQSFLFSPDGDWLCASTNNEVYFWQLDPAALLDDARRLAGRELNADEMERYRLNFVDVQRERLLRQAADLGKQLKKDPQNVALLRQRADLLACAGQYQEAIDELRLLIRLTPDDHWPQYNTLPLLAITGQAEAYRRACESMAAQFGGAESDRLEIYERTAKGSLFWAESGMDWQKVAPLAESALKKATEKNYWTVPWAEIAKGLAEYRLGNYSQALKWADKGLSHEGQANVYSIGVPGNQVKAMALAQLGRLDEAKTALAAAKKLHQSFPKPLDPWIAGWHDWYMSEVLFREADALVMTKATDAAAALDGAGEEQQTVVGRRSSYSDR